MLRHEAQFSFVDCPCGAAGPGFSVDEDAIAAWNQRAAIESTLEREQEALECKKRVLRFIVSYTKSSHLGDVSNAIERLLKAIGLDIGYWDDQGALLDELCDLGLWDRDSWGFGPTADAILSSQPGRSE